MGKGAPRATPALPLHPALRRPGPRSCSLEMLLGSPAEEPQKSRRGCHGSPTRLAYPACLAANRNQVLGTEVVPNTSDLREPLIHLFFPGTPAEHRGALQIPPTPCRAAPSSSYSGGELGVERPGRPFVPPLPLPLLRGPGWRPGGRAGPPPPLRCQARCRSRTWRRRCRC